MHVVSFVNGAERALCFDGAMKMNRSCPECGIDSCRIEFNTLLDSVYCERCVTRFEYPASSKKFVGLIFSFVSFLSALLLFYSESMFITLLFILVVMIPTLYLSIWHADIKVAGLKGLRKRIREKRL